MTVKEFGEPLLAGETRCYHPKFLVDVHVEVVSSREVVATVFRAGLPSEEVSFTDNQINSKALAKLLSGPKLSYTPDSH